MDTKKRAIGIAVLALLAIGGLTYLNRDVVFAPMTDAPVATAPDSRELVGAVPEGGRDIDEYALVTDDFIYFRSITSSSTLKIPNGDPATFERLTGFMEYPGTQVTAECSGPGTYAYYGDAKHVYFYQVWKTPDFTHSKIEIISNEPKEAFVFVSPTSARAGDELFAITPIYATSSCTFDIEA